MNNKKFERKLQWLAEYIERATNERVKIYDDYISIEFQDEPYIREDYSAEINIDGAESIYDVIDNIIEYYEGYDADEYVEMWVNAKYETDREDKLGIPSVRELIVDADHINQEWEDVYQAVIDFKYGRTIKKAA